MNKKRIIGIIVLLLIVIGVVTLGSLVWKNKASITNKETSRQDITNKTEFKLTTYNSIDEIVYYDSENKIYEETQLVLQDVVKYMKEEYPGKKIVYLGSEQVKHTSFSRYSFKQFVDEYIIEDSHISFTARPRYFTNVDEDHLLIDVTCNNAVISLEQVKTKVIDFLYNGNKTIETKDSIDVRIYKCLYKGKEAWVAKEQSFSLIIDANTGENLYSYQLQQGEPIF